MNYYKIYSELIDKGLIRNKKPENGFEIHHIIPVCLKGGNNKDNLVKLTYREHFIAHKLLHLIHKTRGTGLAVTMMICGNKFRNLNIISSRDYKYVKELSRKYTNLKYDKSGCNNPMYNKTVYQIWVDKYGKDIADIKLIEMKNKHKENSINNNPNSTDNRIKRGIIPIKIPVLTKEEIELKSKKLSKTRSVIAKNKWDNLSNEKLIEIKSQRKMEAIKQFKNPLKKENHSNGIKNYWDNLSESEREKKRIKSIINSIMGHTMKKIKKLKQDGTPTGKSTVIY